MQSNRCLWAENYHLTTDFYKKFEMNPLTMIHLFGMLQTSPP